MTERQRGPMTERQRGPMTGGFRNNESQSIG
jgi:hypothetical protein